MTAYQQLLALGFAESETGGGCTALQRTYADGSYHLITIATDPTAPDSNDPPDTLVNVGLYDVTDCEPSADDFQDTLANVADLFRNRAQ